MSDGKVILTIDNCFVIINLLISQFGILLVGSNLLGTYFVKVGELITRMLIQAK